MSAIDSGGFKTSVLNCVDNTRYVGMRGYAWVRMGTRGYAWVCVGTRGYAWVRVGMRGFAWVCVGMRGYAWVRVGMRGYAWVCVGMRGYAWVCVGTIFLVFSNLRKTGNLLNMLYTMSAEFQQPVYKQPGLRFFENNNRIQWSIVMLNNGEQ